ncbi:hypothetical protein ES706_06734 [subsurface metagenome]
MLNLHHILENLTTGGLQRMELIYCFQGKDYQVKAYWVGKIIRIDIEEKKEKEKE